MPRPLQTSHISAIKLKQFRNYASAQLEFDQRHVVLTGPNGAGKTNLMEAVSLLSPGRGLRRAVLRDMAKTGAPDGFSVFSHLVKDDDDFQIGTGTAGQPDIQGSVSRKIRINGTPAKASDELLELCRIAWLTPAMDGLFTGGASDRRRFIDRMVLSIDPQHGRRAADYEKLMRQRNRLLDEAPSGRTNAWLDAIEDQFAALGTALAAARSELIVLLSGLVEQQAGEANADAFPRAVLDLDGLLENKFVAGESASSIETAFRQALAQGRARDRAAGRTLDGPHRTDLLVTHREKNIAAALCSTGEQKALLTGLVLAHAALTKSVAAMTPILLLDEIAAHLDPARRGALFDRIDALGGQAFMTGTDRNLFDAMGERAQYFHVESAIISAS